MDSGFGFHQQLHWNLDLFGFPFDTGDPNTCPGFGNPYCVEDSMLKNAALFPNSGFQQPRENIPNDSPNWFNGMPYFHRALAPGLNSASHDIGQAGSPKMGAPAQKRYLVFDQSGDKTTLLCTPRVEKTPIPPGASWLLNPFKNHPHLSPTLADGQVDENSRDVSGEEMREDTEELNALLCSDSDYSEYDEETSTGHSPSTMTDNYLRGLIKETSEEEVNSFAGPTKRQKLDNGGYYGTLSNGQTASPLEKTREWSSLESDAESCCGGNSNNQCKDATGFPSSGKRPRKDKIRETVNLLQSIIPGAKGKATITVIDEAINYLRDLKVKAKALGLDPV